MGLRPDGFNLLFDAVKKVAKCHDWQLTSARDWLGRVYGRDLHAEVAVRSLSASIILCYWRLRPGALWEGLGGLTVNMMTLNFVCPWQRSMFPRYTTAASILQGRQTVSGLLNPPDEETPNRAQLQRWSQMSPVTSWSLLIPVHPVQVRHLHSL